MLFARFRQWADEKQKAGKIDFEEKPLQEAPSIQLPPNPELVDGLLKTAAGQRAKNRIVHR